eukprot:TRINITY_DN1655_c0_g1_i2.p1 TRINITY_DN1655_c0_g1~~TRINITY_DN1655_c0_g1_i2.p1  ORF type:complete len:293 (-),score=36.00 TRINITY_DN1655_c0_g1_i2:94-972(-)
MRVLVILVLMVGSIYSWWQPTPGTSWDYQIGGPNTTRNVQVYFLDGADTRSSLVSSLRSAGKRVSCYFSAGSVEDWRSDAKQFPSSIIGNDFTGWEGEKYLDIRATTVLEPIFRARLQTAKDKNCDGIEWDNVDTWTAKTGFPLTAADGLTFLRFLSNLTHQYDLSVGLKNNPTQVKDLVSLFDFAVVEDCAQYRECDSYLPFYNQNKAIFAVEYADSCSGLLPQVEGILRDVAVSPSGLFVQCNDYSATTSAPSTLIPTPSPTPVPSPPSFAFSLTSSVFLLCSSLALILL